MRLLHKFRPDGRSRNSPIAPKRGWHHWIWPIAALASMSIVPATVTSAAAAAPPPPPPAPGVTPGAAYVSASENDVLYTATNGTVWVKNLDSGSLAQVSNGVLVSGPSAIYNGSTVIVFGEGTDRRLWWTQRLAAGGYANWRLLGGALTAQPAAVSKQPLHGADAYSVFVVGTDRAVYELDHSSAGWSSFSRIGGRVLAGAGPAAAWVEFPPRPGERTSVAVVGTDRALYIQAPGFPGSTGFGLYGGQTTATPALTDYISIDNLMAFARGTDNAAWYFQTGKRQAVWTSLGGRLSSGLTATTDQLTGNVYVYGLGTDNQVYQKTGNLSLSPPNFSPAFSPIWTQVTGLKKQSRLESSIGIDGLRASSASRALLVRFRVAGGGRWLLMAVREHLGTYAYSASARFPVKRFRTTVSFLRPGVLCESSRYAKTR